MAGRPKIRARREAEEAARAAGEPERDRWLVPRDEWRGLSRADRVERLLDLSLDDCHTLLSIPVRAASAIELNGKIQVIRAVMMTAAKVGIEGHRTEQQDREFEQRVREHEAKINALRRENILSPARELCQPPAACESDSVLWQRLRRGKAMTLPSSRRTP